VVVHALPYRSMRQRASHLAPQRPVGDARPLMALRTSAPLLVLCSALALVGCDDGRLDPGHRVAPDATVDSDAGLTTDDAGSLIDASVAIDAGPADLGAPFDAGVDAGPPPADCHALLDYLGVDWSVAGASIGIADPVRAGPTFAGVTFRYTSSTTATPMLMDCTLAARLYEVATMLAAYDIDEVEHLGIYNYRCISGADPATGCTLSMHAYAKAIDFHAFRQRGTGVTYDVTTDWVISAADPTCPGAPVGDKDRVLHEIACALWSERIFNIVLTPDYNAAHRDHFHVDLTSGSMFIGSSIAGVDPPFPGLGD
jgi:hypothetical protein